MMRMITSQRGLAIVYGVIVLFVASVGGLATLYMARQDHACAADYASMVSSSQAAVAALRACEGLFYATPDTAVAILRKYQSNHDYQWLLASSSSAADHEEKISFNNLTGTAQYAAQIVEFDGYNSFIVIEGIGYCHNGLKKKVLGSYKLDGLKMVEKPPSPGFALFLGGILQNCNAPINITGDVYLSLSGSQTPQHFNQGGTITGNLKTGSSSNVFDICNSLTITGDAFIRAPMTINSLFQVNGKAGFEREITTLNQQMQLYRDAYFNSSYPNTWNSTINLNSHAVQHNPAIPSSKFVNATSTTAVASIDIASALNMTSGDANSDSILLPTWASDVMKNISGNVSASDIETWWTEQDAAGKLYDDLWLVLQLNGDVNMNGGGPFIRKVIWITGNHAINVNGNWYDCHDTSNTMIIVNGSGYINGMGVPTNKKFRGYIYVNTTSNNGVSYQFGTNTIFEGAINQERGTFNLNSGPMNIVFNAGSSGESAVRELADLGILTPTTPVIVEPPVLTLVDVRIRPMMLGLQL